MGGGNLDGGTNIEKTKKEKLDKKILVDEVNRLTFELKNQGVKSDPKQIERTKELEKVIVGENLKIRLLIVTLFEEDIIENTEKKKPADDQIKEWEKLLLID